MIFMMFFNMHSSTAINRTL